MAEKIVLLSWVAGLKLANRSLPTGVPVDRGRQAGNRWLWQLSRKLPPRVPAKPAGEWAPLSVLHAHQGQLPHRRSKKRGHTITREACSLQCSSSALYCQSLLVLPGKASMFSASTFRTSQSRAGTTDSERDSSKLMAATSVGKRLIPVLEQNEKKKWALKSF